jgi:hypothetical protein
MNKLIKRYPTFLCISLLVYSFAFADSGSNHKVKQSLPIKMGTSGGSIKDTSKAFCCGGTLGALVNYDGSIHILSNNHVLGRSGSATSGEDTLQPALIDSSCRATGNVVGDYKGNLVPLGSNVDAALSLARTGTVDTTGSIIDIGVPCSEPQAAALGLSVMKSGRTTGFTTGSIQAVDVSVSIQYQKGCNSGKKFTVTYTNQIATGNMSSGGDSGSLLLSNDGTPNPVGLLYAGSSTTTIYNPVADVAAAFSNGGHSFSFVGNNCGTPSIAPAISSVSTASFNQARQSKAKNERALLKRTGVLGVGVGAANDGSSDAAIVLFVQSHDGSQPQGLPKHLDGAKVRLILTDTIVAQ